MVDSVRSENELEITAIFRKDYARIMERVFSATVNHLFAQGECLPRISRSLAYLSKED